MDKIEELYSLIPKGTFSDLNAFRDYTDKNGVSETFGLIDKNTFSNQNAFNDYFGTVKKKENTTSTSNISPSVISEQTPTNTSGLESDVDFDFLKQRINEKINETPQDRQVNFLKDVLSGKSQRDKVQKEKERKIFDDEIESEFKKTDFNKDTHSISERRGLKDGIGNDVPENVSVDGFDNEKMNALNQKLFDAGTLTEQEISSIDSDLDRQKRGEFTFFENIKIKTGFKKPIKEKDIEKIRGLQIHNKIQQKQSDFFKSLEPKEVELFKSFIVKRNDKLTDEFIVADSFNQKLQDNVLNPNKIQIDNIDKSIREIFEKGNQNRTEKDVQNYNLLLEERNKIVEKSKLAYEQYKSNSIVLQNNQDDILSFDSELDLAKRDYNAGGFWEEIYHSTKNIITGTSDFVSSNVVTLVEGVALNIAGQMDEQSVKSVKETFKSVKEGLSDIAYNRAFSREERANKNPLPRNINNVNSVSDFGGYMSNMFSQQIPIYATIYATGGLGLGIVSASSGGQRFQDIQLSNSKGDTKIPFNTAVMNGNAYAGAEYVFEQYTLGWLNKNKRLLKSATKDALTKKTFKESFSNGLNKIYRGTVTAIGEGNTEALTGTFQKLSDNVLTGTNKDIMDNTEEWFGGFFMGGGTNLSFSALNFVKGAYSKKESRKKVSDNTLEIMSYDKLINEGNLDDNALQFYKGKINSLVEENNSIINFSTEQIQGLTQEEFKEITDINYKLRSLQITLPKVDKNFKKVILQDIQELSNKKDLILDQQKTKLFEKNKANETKVVKPIKADFDNTIYNNKTGELTTLGQSIKQKIAKGEDVTILTARDNTQENRQFIADRLGISPDKIKLGLSPEQKSQNVNDGDVFFDDNSKNTDAVKQNTNAEVVKVESEFIDELTNPNDNVEDLGDTAKGVVAIKKGDTTVTIKETKDKVVLESIETKDDAKGKGEATKVIKEVTDVADKQNKEITLNVVPKDQSTDAKRLTEFYEKNGFVKDSNFNETGAMTRVPQTQENIETQKLNEQEFNDYENALEQGVIEDSLIEELNQEEIYRAYQDRNELNKSLPLLFSFLNDNLGRIRGKDFDSYSDKNNRKGDKSFSIRFLSNKALPLDVLVQELSDQFGKEITPQDAIDFILDKQSNPDNYKKSNIKSLNKASLIDFDSKTNSFNLFKSLDNSIKSFKLIDSLERKGVISFEQSQIIKEHLKLKNETETTNIKASRSVQQFNETSTRSETDSKEKTEKENRTESVENILDNKDNQSLDSVLSKLDSLKVDTKNTLNVTLPFLPQAWNLFIESLKVATKLGFATKKALDFAYQKVSEKYGKKEADSVLSNLNKLQGTKAESKNTPSNKKAITDRSIKSENLNQNVKDILNDLDVNNDTENQNLAIENAEKIISKLGLEQAYKNTKNGNIRGGAKTWIQSKMVESINYKLDKAKDIDEIQSLSNELAEIIEYWADESKLKGQEISMLNKVYSHSNIQYNYDFARKKWKEQFGEDPSPNISARLKHQENVIKKLEESVKVLEEKLGNQSERQAFDNIKESYKRSLNQPTKSSLRKASEVLRKTKFTQSLSDIAGLKSSPLSVITGIYDGAIETIATALDAGATISEALQKGINKIKNSSWYKSLSRDSKSIAVDKLKNHVEPLIQKNIKIEVNQDIEQSDIKISQSLLFELVATGNIDNINDLSKAVLDVLSSKYPNLTLREVRDSITGYGKQINETQNIIKRKIAKLKIDGRQISALEDLEQGKRPKRSGFKRPKLTPEQRNRIKKIKELLKKLPIDDLSDRNKFYQTALENYKKRVQNRINDLQDAIDKNERIIKEKTSLKLDNQTKDLIKRRDKLQKQYAEKFGKTPKNHETLVNEILTRKENNLNNLLEQLEFIQLNKKERTKKPKRITNDPRIDLLNKRIDEAKSDLSDLLDEVGIAETKRIAKAKKYIDKRINYYKERLKAKDFSKPKPRPLVSNREIALEKKKLLDAKNKFNSEFEKQEKKNRTFVQKSLDFLFEFFNISKGLLASFDFSAMFRQGIVLGSSNPKEFAIATKRMHQFVSKNNYDLFMSEIENSDDFILMTESGLSITDTSGDVLKSEERFLSNLTQIELKIRGIDINILGIGQKISERAYSGFLNSIRVDVFRKGVEVYKTMGITPSSDPKAYKALARTINNATGRGATTQDKSVNKFLNTIFFSPKMITGMFGLLRDTYRKDATPYTRKLAMKSLATFIAYQGIIKLLLGASFVLIQSLFIDDDDKEEIKLFNFDPTDTDFNKVRIGNTRYDTSAGWGIMIRTIARFVTEEKTNEKGTVNLNKGYKSSVWDEPINYFKNKLSPSARFFYNYKADKHPTDIFKKRSEATTYDYAQGLFIPLTISSTIESIENDTPTAKAIFDFILNAYGINSITYPNKKK